MEQFVVYVLYSERANRLYIGFSSVSIERFHWHNEKSKNRIYKELQARKMIHVEFFDAKGKALLREKALKSGQGRNFIRIKILPNMRALGFISA